MNCVWDEEKWFEKTLYCLVISCLDLYFFKSSCQVSISFVTVDHGKILIYHIFFFLSVVVYQLFIRLRCPQHDCALYKDESSISRDASSKQGELVRRALPLPPSETFQSSLIKNSSLSNSPLIPTPREQSFCILNSGNTFQTERGQTLPREQWWQHAFWSLATTIVKAERSWRRWTNKISRMTRMEKTVGTL